MTSFLGESDTQVHGDILKSERDKVQHFPGGIHLTIITNSTLSPASALFSSISCADHTHLSINFHCRFSRFLPTNISMRSPSSSFPFSQPLLPSQPSRTMLSPTESTQISLQATKRYPQYRTSKASKKNRGTAA